jgi:SSS family solute:Na+ symporter
MIILSFLFFTLLVAALTFWITRKDDHKTSQGFFLGGRSLGWPLIAGSLLLTNLSTEQLVGLNGAAFTHGLAVMVWEVIAVIALVMMALFFLPRFLKSGVTTVPEYLELRFDHQTQVITNMVFLIAYAVILLPIILYTGATGLIGILDVQGILGLDSHAQTLWVIVWTVGLIGSVYALFGGLRTVAVSDFLNGIGLLAGGLMITWFGLNMLGDGDFGNGLEMLVERNEGRFNSIGGPDSSVPFGTVFTGILLLNLFYWTTNQQIIQRTFGARSLAEGQKGVLATGLLKLVGPMYLVIPGMIAFAVLGGQGLRADHAYGELVRLVLPTVYAGFFAAVMLGAILSSFNSALNSTCTLFGLGLYQSVFNKDADSVRAVRAGKVFGWIIAAVAMTLAPLLDGQISIYAYLQKMNGIYFIPIFAVVLVGMLTKRVPSIAAKIALVTGFLIIAIGYFLPSAAVIVDSMHEFHFLGLVFTYIVILMLGVGEFRPRPAAWIQKDVKAVDMTPWRYSRVAGLVLVAAAVTIYVAFADLSIIWGQTPISL